MTANDRFKQSFRAWFWASMLLATALHFALVSLWPELTAQDLSLDPDELVLVDLPPEIVIPPAPQPISRPASPVPSPTVFDEDITISPTTFDENPVDKLPPPPDSVYTTAVSEINAFTPFTVRPDIKNRGEIERALIREYPPLLRDAGIGGTVEVWFHIDEEGVVRETRVRTGSGYAALDEAALAVADIMKFTPAQNRDKVVPVWVQMPIKFEVR